LGEFGNANSNFGELSGSNFNSDLIWKSWNLSSCPSLTATNKHEVNESAEIVVSHQSMAVSSVCGRNGPTKNSVVPT